MISEFQFINHIKKRFSLDRVGDDCAVLPKNAEVDLLITADLLIEEIDFRIDWASPLQIGYKALSVSLSDIAAMGGTPASALLSVGVPQRLWNSGFPENLLVGWHELAAKFAVELIGGDISKSPGKLVLDSIVLGEVPKGKAVLRSGARPGHAIFVSGALGGASGGLGLLQASSPQDNPNGPEANLRARQLRPFPQVDLGKRLRELGIISSMIDVSDGLASDLKHICDASNVGSVLDAENIPIDPNLREVMRFDESLDAALNGGEDFELLFTISESNIPALADLPVTRIGSVTSHTGRLELIRNGTVESLVPSGFQHF
jgi:thiamine-monophosphate kinase